MAIRKIDYYQGLADEMIEEDKERDNLYLAMENMHHLEWDLPSGMREYPWIRKFMTTDPFDALRGLTRVLSTVTPKIKVQALGPHEDDKKNANDMERSLTWLLKSAGGRGRAKLVSDIVLSAARHDEVCAQVLSLEVQGKLVGMDERRIKNARRHGPFAVLVRNPRFVHSRFSDWMLEDVLYARVIPGEEAVSFWGDKAREIELKIRDNPKNRIWVTVYDYWNLDMHTVWAIPSDQNRMPQNSKAGIVLLEPQEHGLDFIPWVVQVGGTNLDNRPEYQRFPLLYSVYRAGQWASQNIAETIVNSEILAHAAAPRGMTESANPENPPEVDYGDPLQLVNLRVGERYTQLQPPGMDVNLMNVSDRIADAISKSTLPKVLQTGEFPSGTAFATLNLATQSAVKAIAPHKVLAENAIADICKQMLYWVKQDGKALVTYGKSSKGLGEQLLIDPDLLPVDDLYIEVELTADVPTDRMARINAAAIAVTQLGMSRERALEEAGIENPAQEIRQSSYEALIENEVKMVIQEKQMQQQMKFQAMQQQMKMEMQMQMQQQQQMQMQQQQMQGGMEQEGVGSGGWQTPLRPEPPGIPGVGGQGFNPAMGGMPAQMANPYATRELQTNTDRQGLEMAEEGEV